MEKRIAIHHFGPLREARGCSAEAVSTEAATPRELYAVNDTFAPWDVPLADGACEVEA